MTHADSIWAKSLELHSDSLQSKVDSLQVKLDALQAKSDLMYSVVESANSGIANQLSTITIWLEFIAIVIAVGGGILGFYISKKRREIERMARTVDEKKLIVESLAGTVDVKKQAVETLAGTVDEKKQTVEALAEIVDGKKKDVEVLAKATEALDIKIHSDISGLYKDLRDEETKALFQRLVAEPQDIVNLERLLLARVVKADNFPLLKEAFLKLPEAVQGDNDQDDYEDVKHSFLLQFFQHFFYLSLKDDDIRPVFIENFKNVFNNGYESDIRRATEGLCKALTDEDSTFDKVDVLTEFLKAINTSKFENYALLRKMLEDNLSEQGLLQNAIERCVADNVNISLFKGRTSKSAQATSQEKKK